MPFGSSRNEFFSAGDRRRCGKTEKRMPSSPRGGIRVTRVKYIRSTQPPERSRFPYPERSRANRLPRAAGGGFFPRVEDKPDGRGRGDRTPNGRIIAKKRTDDVGVSAARMIRHDVRLSRSGRAAGGLKIPAGPPPRTVP